MGRASRRKKGKAKDAPEVPGSAFIHAIQSAQKADKDKFIEKFGRKMEVTFKDGEMQVKPSNEKTDS